MFGNSNQDKGRKMSFLRKLFRGKKNYLVLDSLESFIIDDETSDVVRLLEAQPRLLRQTNAKGLSALHIAAMTRKPVMISILLQHGADPNIRTSRDYHFSLTGDVIPLGSTALHFAALQPGWTGNIPLTVQVARTLINNGASTNIRNKKDDTPLAIAEAMECSQMCEFLRRRGD